jgi:hypothetical protein
MATPLIRIPQEQGGTMYAFSSAARDLTRAYYNPDIVFEYSKFALLDLPVAAEPSQGSTSNYIQFENLFDASGADYVPNSNANVDFAQTFQNYALNFENFILNDDDFDAVRFASDSEKIFFKWLHHLGGFRVRQGTSQEVESGYARVVEEDDSLQTGSEYSRVVKYIGNIDVTNDKNYQGNTYNEVFVNVPSYVGYTPDVLFKVSNFNTTATAYSPTDFINGRAGQTHPDPNINLEALADNNSGQITLDVNNGYAYGIEFNPYTYAQIVNDPKLNNLVDYAKRGGDFRFNAILVYYDVYSKSNAAQRSTNLYGIIILDNWKEDPAGQGWYIPEVSKYKPNDVTGLNGNAFALKLNVKFNSSLDNVGIEKNINDFTTFSMDVFFDTTSALENAAKVLAEANNNHADILKRLYNIENAVLTSAQQTDILARLADVEESLEAAALNFENSGSILQLISSTNKRLNQVISGEIPTELQYNTDVVVSGDGVVVDKSTPNKIKINNTNYGYTLSESRVYNFQTGQIVSDLNASNKFNPANAASQGVWTRVKKYDNLIRLYLEQEKFEYDFNIYIDDSTVGFKLGQVVKMSFRDKIYNLNNKSINVYIKTGGSWLLKGSIPASELISTKPYIEMVCVDAVNKTFEFDIIR